MTAEAHQNPETISLTQVIEDAPYGKPTGSLHRALELLELFAVEQRPLTVGEVAQNLGYPQSSTSVLLRGLADLGYITHDRHARTYFPTLRVSFLGMWLHQRLISQGSLLDFMEHLAKHSGHVAMLGMQNGLHAQYIHIVAARTSRVGLKPGLLRSICRSAIGKILLSTMDDAQILRIARNASALEHHFPHPIDTRALLKEIEEIRRSGFAFTEDSINRGASVIATRLPINFGGLPIAVGIGIHTWEKPKLEKPIIELLQTSIQSFFPEASNIDGQCDTSRTQAIQTPYAVSRSTSVHNEDPRESN